MGSSFTKLTDSCGPVAGEGVPDADLVDRNERLRQRRRREVAGGERFVGRRRGAAADRARFETQVDGLNAAPVGTRAAATATDSPSST
jgi:hypothetical protein